MMHAVVERALVHLCEGAIVEDSGRRRCAAASAVRLQPGQLAAHGQGGMTARAPPHAFALVQRLPRNQGPCVRTFLDDDCEVLPRPGADVVEHVGHLRQMHTCLSLTAARSTHYVLVC